MAKSGTVVSGKIHTDAINATHSKIKEIVNSFTEINQEVHDITNIVKENWVGEGRNEFQSQYERLITKIDDFGDTLLDIYEALVKAEAEYATTDDSLRQDFVMAMEE